MWQRRFATWRYVPRDAAKKTEELIKQSVLLAEEGETISNNVNENLSEIVDSVGKVTAIVGEITMASQEQSRGIEHVNTAMTQMEQVTLQTAANSQETSSASEELAAQAHGLAAMIGEFQLQRDEEVDAPEISHRTVLPSDLAFTPDDEGIPLLPEDLIPVESDRDLAEF